MEIEYKFVTGEKVHIEVCEELSEIILELDRELKNNNRKETRRHESLSLFDKDEQSIDSTSDVCEDVLKNLDKDKLYEVLSRLNHQEQELIHRLYLDVKPITQEQYANYLGIKVKSVQEKSRRIRRKLEILMDEK